jgi:hypothetical protein
VDAKLAG